MSKRIFYVIILIAAVEIVGGTYAAKRGATINMPYAGVSASDLPAVVGEPSLSEEKIPFTETVNYQEYTSARLSTALQSGRATLLYFYADWCSSCRIQEPINAIFFKQALDDGLAFMGIRIDIDDYPKIAREYGVNYQHSYVLLDRQGQPVAKFFGEQSVEDLKRYALQVL